MPLPLPRVHGRLMGEEAKPLPKAYRPGSHSHATKISGGTAPDRAGTNRLPWKRISFAPPLISASQRHHPRYSTAYGI